MKKLKYLVIAFVLFVNTAAMCCGVSAQEGAIYDYSSFVGDWHKIDPDDLNGDVVLNILSVTDNKTIRFSLDGGSIQEEPIVDNKVVWTEYGCWYDGWGNRINEMTKTLTFYDDHIHLDYSHIAIEWYDEIIFVSDTIKPVRMDTYTCSVTLNGKKIAFDQPPVIVNDRTLVPIRAVIEAMNGSVSWDAQTKKVTLTLGSDVIELTVDSTTAYLNGEAKQLDVPPQIINDRTLMPIRFIAEGFKFDVEWDGARRTVEINQNSDANRVNMDLCSCIGKTKNEMVALYGPIVDSNSWLGGKLYIHSNLKSEIFYENPDNSYDHTKHDDVAGNEACTIIFASLSELLNSPDKTLYTVAELEQIFGQYEFVNDLNNEFYPLCQYRFRYGNYEIIVESDRLDPFVEYVYIIKNDPRYDVFKKFVNEQFENIELKMQATPYSTIQYDDDYITSKQKILAYDYFDVDMDGEIELVISSKVLSGEYDMGGSCFSVWECGDDGVVYNVFAKCGMQSRASWRYMFVEYNGKTLLLESNGITNSVSRSSNRILYTIEDGVLTPYYTIEYDSNGVCLINGAVLSEEEVLAALTDFDNNRTILLGQRFE